MTDINDNFDPVPFESTVRDFPDDPLQNYSLRRLIVDECAKGNNNTLGEQFIVNDDKLVKAIADIVRSDPNLIKFFKEIVLHSNDSFSETSHKAAANAITILTAANIPFFDEKFQDIKIRWANIRDGIFTNCDFSGADFTGVKMKNCKMQGANFSKATMKDIDLGVYPQIECPFQITMLKLSPEKPGDYFLMSVHKNDAKVIIWNLSTHEKIQELEGNAGAFSPDDSCYAIANQKNIQIWKEVNKFNFKLLRTLEGHLDLVNLLEFTSNGEEIISASLDKTIKLWEVKSGILLKSFQGHTDYITAISYCHQFSYIVSSSCDKSIIIWSKETGKLIKKITDHHDVVNSVNFFEKGEKFISTSDESPSTLKVWNSKTGTLQANLDGFHYNGVKSLSFSKSGNLFVSVSKEKILVLDHHSKSIIIEIPMIGEDLVFSAIFSPDETQIISGGTDKKITFTNCTSAKSKKIYEGPSLQSLITSLAISPDGTSIVSGGNDNLVKLWSKTSGKMLRVYQAHTGEVSAISFSPNGSHIMSGSRDKTCILWNKISGLKVEEFKADEPVTSLAFPPDSDKKFVCAAGKALKIFTISPKKLIMTGEGHTDFITMVAYSFDGLRIVTGSVDRTVILWDTNGKVLKTFEGHSGPVYSVGFSPKDGSKIISAGYENTIRVWDKDSGDVLQEIPAHYHDINSVAYSPDEKFIISGSNDTKVKIFNEADGSCLKTLDAHTNHVTHVCYSGDGTFFCSAGKDSVIRVWQRSMKDEWDYCLLLEIASDETIMKCNDMIIWDVNELSEFNKKILLENGAKTYHD